jgi:hypothetical protein
MFVAAAICGLAFTAGAAAVNAKETGKSSEKATVTVKGKVLEIKNKEGKLLAVKITTKGGAVHFVTLDAKGKQLGLKMGGKTVEATGILTVKNKEKWLTVEKYKEPIESLPSI